MSGIEIVTIGDELVEGRLVDAHSAYLSQKLFEAGLLVTRHISVGDEAALIRDVLLAASNRAAAVIVCGGLGPTTDDLTAVAAADAFGRQTVLYPEALEHVSTIFTRMGRTMTPNNEKQAWLPEGSMLLPNSRGTACGFHLDYGTCRLYFLPGVPHEMQAMFTRQVLPDLLGRLTPRSVRIGSLRTFGLGESKIGHVLEGLEVDPPGHLLIQYRATMPEVDVRLCLTGFEPADPAGDVALERLMSDAARRIGPAVFSRGAESLPEVVLSLLMERGQTLTTAESCTGGMLSALLTDISGASRVFVGGVVSYSNEVKASMLDVPEALLIAHGAVSAEVACAMASGARHRLGSDYALSITGVAGPTGGTEEKPVGTVFLGLASAGGVESRKVFFPGHRDRIRKYSAYSALDLLRRYLLDIPSA